MNSIVIKNCKLAINGILETGLEIKITNNIIDEIGSNLEGDTTIDAKGLILAPGFIDIHTHGALTRDSLENDIEAHNTIANFHLSHGTTSYYPTFLAAPIDVMQNAIDKITKKTNGSRALGIHIEGTFCSKNKKGAQDEKFLLEFDDKTKNFFKRNSNIIKRITLAPDINNSKDIVKFMKSLNIQVSLGHDNSYEDEINGCISLGANSTTHLFNCTSTMKRVNSIKKLGLTEISLCNDSMFVELIADSYHVPNSILEMVHKNKGKNKIVLVSDSIPLAGMKEGDSCFFDVVHSEREIKIVNNMALLTDSGVLAGSISSINSITKNILKNTNIPIAEIIKMGSENPSDLLQLENVGKIKRGYLADLNILDYNLNVVSTLLDGKLVYTSV